jgi:dipeptidyl aminopeptidase/acylaminoacyl peptidase
MARIESLLAARLFLAPQVVGDRIYFVSNMAGRLGLYAMDFGGSVPEPILPPDIALQNPHLMEGPLFVVFPGLGKILVMIDRDGNEIYQPMFVPLVGGFPEPVFEQELKGKPSHLIDFDLERGIVYFFVESRTEPVSTSYRGHLARRRLEKLSESTYMGIVAGANEAHTKAIIVDVYGAGDHAVYLSEAGTGGRRLLYGKAMEDREPGETVEPNTIGDCQFVDEDRAILFFSSLWSDTYGLGYMELDEPSGARPVAIEGAVHKGLGELVRLGRVADNRYLVGYNIDGCSWLYEGEFDSSSMTMRLGSVLVGAGDLSDGVLEACRYDRDGDRYALSFSTAVSPTQIYTIEGAARDVFRRHTRERVLGIAEDALSAGEDASFTSFDGLGISARLYLPAASLGYKGPRPLVYYVHGGPRSQERPDFAWFSMPLIQFLTLSGFAVFVPNVRGSTGYGFDYAKRVERDWGGQDRLDHVHAMTRVLPGDDRIDTSRAGVVGRSYGGYMTLTLASRHPELWSAAVDMFGPYDLPGFASRVPETWKPYIVFMIGDPEADREFLLERSPGTYIDAIACPLLVIQGKNDPRVVEVESRELVEKLRKMGKDVDYLMFEDEGHDVLKHENRVRCYNAIADFFRKHLRP